VAQDQVEKVLAGLTDRQRGDVVEMLFGRLDQDTARGMMPIAEPPPQQTVIESL
jgi:hypothetical protein